jgi:hypothetical protein
VTQEEDTGVNVLLHLSSFCLSVTDDFHLENVVVLYQLSVKKISIVALRKKGMPQFDFDLIYTE